MLAYNVLIISDQLETAKAHAAVLSLRGLHATAAKLKDADPKVDAGSHITLIDSNERHDERLPSVLRQVRSQAAMPLLLMTYEQDERSLLEYYRIGIDECIAKPIGIELLYVKVKAWLRRVGGPELQETNGAGILRSGFHLSSDRRTVTTPDGTTVRLSRLESLLAHLFFTNNGRILETEFIRARVWANTDENDSDLVKNLVYRLRRKIEPDMQNPKYLQTIPGQGYIFLPH
jgi:two-component system KDP operon response regulator KdpE